MGSHFEAVGNMADWPPNVPGKPTQAAVVGAYHPKKGKAFELLWHGQFPDLQPALYWAAKKEVEAVRKGKWLMACRVAWQHEMSPEQALEAMRRHMEPQMDQALRSYRRGGDIDIGPGPMRAITPDESAERYVEIVPAGDPEADPLASFVLPAVGPPNDPRPPRPPQG